MDPKSTEINKGKSKSPDSNDQSGSPDVSATNPLLALCPNPGLIFEGLVVAVGEVVTGIGKKSGKAYARRESEASDGIQTFKIMDIGGSPSDLPPPPTIFQAVRMRVTGANQENYGQIEISGENIPII